MADSRRIDVDDVAVAADEITFSATNASDDQVYDILKLYIGETYVGFDYLDLDPGETRSVTFYIKNIDAGEDLSTVLTTHNRDDGVLFETPFGELAGGEPETAEESAEEEPEQEQAEREGADETASEPVEPAEPEEPGDGGEAVSEEHSAPDTEPASTEPGEPAPRETEDEVEEMVAARDAEETGPEEHHGYVSSLMGSLFGRGEKEPEEEEAEEAEEPAGEEDGEQVQRAMAVEEEGPSPSEQVNRVSTGIIDLDDKMQGGLVEGTMNLVTGKTGTGKTAFCATFLKRGADLDEPGVYVTTEERKEDIKADIQAMFGWDIEDLEEEGNIKVMSIKPIFPSKEIENLNRLVRSYITDLLDNVKQAINELDADRVVIDSVSIIEMFIRDEYMARVALSSLLNSLREADVTAVLTGTVPETSEGLSGGGIIEFLVDTVILLEFVPVAEEHKRTLTIRKMRRTNHAVDIFPMEITRDGLRVYPPR